MKQNIDVSIIILNYNTKDLLLACLASIAKAKDSNTWEVIVLDNASTDGSFEAVKNEKLNLKSLKIIQNEKNLGFAAGNNVGIRQAKGTYILLLNSDTEVSANTITETKSFLDEHPEAGAATCKLMLPDGTMDPACHRGFPTPWASFTYMVGLEKIFPHSQLFARYHLGFKDLHSPQEIDSPSGAFFMIRRTVIEKVGLLDEDYFMYGEDLDWAYRMKKAGFSIWFYPYASIIHRKKQSGREHVDPAVRKQTRQYFYDTMQLFYKKHYSRRYGWLLSQLVMLGIRFRSLL